MSSGLQGQGLRNAREELGLSMRDVEMRSANLATADPERFGGFSRNWVHQLEYRGRSLLSATHNPKNLHSYIQIVFNGDSAAFEAALGQAPLASASTSTLPSQLRIVQQGSHLGRADLHMLDRDTVEANDVLQTPNLLIRAQGSRMSPVINDGQLVGVRLGFPPPEDFMPVVLVRLNGALQLGWLLSERQIAYMQVDATGNREVTLASSDDVLGIVVWVMPGLPLAGGQPLSEESKPSAQTLQYV